MLTRILLAAMVAVVLQMGVWSGGAFAAPAEEEDLPGITVVSKKQVVSKKKPAVTQSSRPPRSAPANSSAPPADAAILGVSAADGSGAAGVASAPTTPLGLASEMRISGDRLNQRPATRPGEVLEAVPGLIVTQHSGEGKANQYFLRGYNLDHGTDLAIHVDDVPVNMRTHGHGQGYADLNWLMPETINSLDIRKGPYFADEGDFSSVGNLHIGLVDRTDRSTASVTVGSFGYRRLFGMGSTKVGDGTLLVAGEAGVYNGPWDNPDDVRKLNSLLRYSQGTATDGFSITGMAYSNRWNSTDQVPTRAFEGGLISRFGAIDPTDGGSTNRFAVSGRVAGTDSLGTWKANAYVVKSSLDLYNDFTYFLSDPVLGDQFRQHDGRLMMGGGVSRILLGSIGNLPVETVVGLQSRFDDIDLALTNTFRRDFSSNIRSDKVKENSVGIFAENTVHWANWLRTTVGWRGDYYNASVNSLFNGNNSGNANQAIGSPKFRMVFGPFYQTEVFLGAGLGMHSNDARGATTTESPTDPTTRVDPSPFLVRTKGAEVGFKTRIVPGLTSTVSVFMLDQASEILFSGDAGDTEASRASHRYGVEFTNDYRPFSWLSLDADLAMTRARFVGYNGDQADLYASLSGFPEAQIGNAPGNYIPNAPSIVASAGVTLGDKTGWFGGLRWRYLGAVPLTEDNAFRSQPISIVNGRIGYRTTDGWRIQLDILNLLNSETNQISYGYGSLLKTDALYNLCYPVQAAPAAVCQTGVMGAVVHPAEPLAVRLTVAGSF